jgi:hypothetical protein
MSVSVGISFGVGFSVSADIADLPAQVPGLSSKV